MADAIPPDDYSTWNEYWTKAHNQPWRREPEIDEQRQRYLAERRAVEANVEQGVYPFRDEKGSIRLTRADVEWLLATHEESRGPVRWEDIAHATLTERFRTRKRLDLRGANLTGAHLDRLPLTHLYGGLRKVEWESASQEQREAAAIHLEGATLREVHLEGAELRAAHFEGANLWQARMQEARLTETHLEGAYLYDARLNGATLVRTYMGSRLLGDEEWEAIKRFQANVPKHLPPANLQNAYFDESTVLQWPHLVGDDPKDSSLIADVRWGNVNLGLVDWARVSVLGDEVNGRDPLTSRGKVRTREESMEARLRTVRTYRQLANNLRQQGINEQADRFSYRGQLCQRLVLRRQRKLLRYLGSLLLDLISGYGYKPMRSLITYLLVVGVFAITYYLLGSNVHPPLDPLGAVVFSITSFHGRGFAPGENVAITNPVTVLAACEAIIGLLIEITFIATFTQRFFAR